MSCVQRHGSNNSCKQINVPGSFWQGRMLVEERDTYKCTILDFSLAHKFSPDALPRQAFSCWRLASTARAATSKAEDAEKGAAGPRS